MSSSTAVRALTLTQLAKSTPEHFCHREIYTHQVRISDNYSAQLICMKGPLWITKELHTDILRDSVKRFSKIYTHVVLPLQSHSCPLCMDKKYPFHYRYLARINAMRRQWPAWLLFCILTTLSILERCTSTLSHLKAQKQNWRHQLQESKPIQLLTRGLDVASWG